MYRPREKKARTILSENHLALLSESDSGAVTRSSHEGETQSEPNSLYSTYFKNSADITESQKSGQKSTAHQLLAKPP